MVGLRAMVAAAAEPVLLAIAITTTGTRKEY
jgi:hypothetical protein